MDSVPTAVLVAGRGLQGNANIGGRRQVTLIELEVWQELMRTLGANLPSSTRRANLVVSGLPLRESRGRELRVGDTVLRIGGETKPCEQMEEALPGLRALMYPDWRGGAFAEVIEGGPVHVGDPVEWREAPP
jgi:MOSC domain-containing protein YiiM